MSTESKIEQIQARRAAAKATAAAADAAQFAVDLEALADLEDAHGPDNVSNVRIPLVDGLPVLAVCRTPKPSEAKRYREMVRPDSKGRMGDAARAAEALAAVTLIYPTAEQFAAMCEARPGLATQVGLEAARLATGRSESEGK